MAHHQGDHRSCCEHGPNNSVHQTLDEMEFERGLWSAALNGETDRVKSLLNNGKDPCQQDSSGYTALHYASRNGHVDVCKELLYRGACVNACTRSGGVTSLHRASYCGHNSVVKELLRHKADANICDSDGMTALHKACEKDHYSIADMLLKKAPQTKHTQDNKGRLAFDYVKDQGSDKWKLLLSVI